MQVNNVEKYIKQYIGERSLAEESSLTNEWLAWYYGFYDKFHRYTVYNAGQEVELKKLTLGMAKKVCEDWANLLMNEKTDIVIPNNQDELNEILEREDFWPKANEAIEKSFALGNGAFVLRLENARIDEQGKIWKSDSTELKIDFINATKIRPITFKNGDITECAFVNEGTNEATISLHLLEDGQYIIKDIILKRGVNGFQLEQVATLYTGSNIKWFSWIKPRKANNININSPLGVSIYCDAIDNLKFIDNIFDGFNNEYQLGKKRIMVASEAVKIDVTEGTPRKVFDTNDVVYYNIPMGNDGKPIIQDINSELRSQAYIDGLNNQLSIFGSKCGLGESYYKFDAMSSRPVQTATASKLMAQNLYRSINKQEVMVRKMLIQLTKAIIYVNNTWTSAPTIKDVNYSEIQIKFDDAISMDKEAEREKDLADVSAKLMSKKEYVMKWYLMTEIEADEYLHSNLLLLDDYSLALSSGAMTPEDFVAKVYGYAENSAEYIRAVEWAKEQVGAGQDTGFEMNIGA